MGMLGSAAGTGLSHPKGSEAEKSQQDTANQARQADGEKNAEDAAGIGETEQDQQTDDRDADGRRLWEKPVPGPSSKEAPQEDTPASRDATSQRGNQLDISG